MNHTYDELEKFYGDNYHGHHNVLKLWNDPNFPNENFITEVSGYLSYLEKGDVLDIGCGPGHRVWALQQLGYNAYGCDISKFAIENAVTKRCTCHDILDSFENGCIRFYNVIIFDVLEHIPLEYIDKAIENCERLTKKIFLARIPYNELNTEFSRNLSDLFMEHMIHTPPEWWLEKFRKVFSGWKELYERVPDTDWWMFRYERIEK